VGNNGPINSTIPAGKKHCRFSALTVSIKEEKRKERERQTSH
jgi:hypothetical protein